MSKIIWIFSVFIVIIALIIAVFAANILPKTLLFFEKEIIATGKNYGLVINIEDTKFAFPDKILFENAEISNIQNPDFSAKIFRSSLSVSLIDYAKAYFKMLTKKEKYTLFDFSDFAELEEISLFYKENQVMSGASAEIDLTKESLKYKVSADTFNFGDIAISKIEIDGILDSTMTNFTAKGETLGGFAGFIADYDSRENNFNISKISLKDIDLQNKFPDVSGILSGQIIPKTLPAGDFSNFDEIVKQISAECVLSIKNFKLNNNKYAKPILDAIYFVGITDLNFQKINADISYSYTNSCIKNLRADNFKYAISAAGTFIPKTQKLNIDSEIHFNPDMKFAIQKNIWDSMLPASPNNQGRKLTGKISGNINNISVKLDTEIVKRGVNSLLSEISKLF